MPLLLLYDSYHSVWILSPFSTFKHLRCHATLHQHFKSRFRYTKFRQTSLNSATLPPNHTCASASLSNRVSHQAPQYLYSQSMHHSHPTTSQKPPQPSTDKSHSNLCDNSTAHPAYHGLLMEETRLDDGRQGQTRLDELGQA